MAILKDYLPERLLSMPVADFQDAFQPEIDKLAAEIAGTTEYELFAKTADKWLTLWETAYGIPIDPDKPLAERRSRLMSKIRGAGTTTAEMIRQVVASYANSDCEIIEHNEDYRFDVKFVGTIGIPPNMDDVRAALEEIKPAHLAYQFIYLFRTWKSLEGYRWMDLEKYTWQQLKEGIL